MPDSDVLGAAARPQSTALGLGERLRSARKARAISVAQVADALKVEESSVLALEAERFAELGAPVFVRGHLRRYSELVGLSPEAVLEAYRTAVPDSDALPLVARRREASDGVQVGPWVYWLVAALVVAGIVMALSGGGGDEPAPADVIALPAVNPPEGVVPPPAAPVPQESEPPAADVTVPPAPDQPPGT